MRNCLAVFALLILAGCGKSDPAVPPQEDPSDSGKWTVIPAGNDERSQNIQSWNAWRLDTQTGAVEFCTYAIIKGDNGVPSQNLSCSAPNAPKD
jgi:hypothetical protein